MDGNRSSNSAVIPEIPEVMTSSTDHSEDKFCSIVTSTQAVCSSAIALPVESLAVTAVPVVSGLVGVQTAAGFSVLTPNDIQAVPVQQNSLKPTHLVLKTEPSSESTSGHPDISAPSTPTTPSTPFQNKEHSVLWEQAAQLEVLPIRCKHTSAELHKSRFGSGGRGRCIKVGNDWYTPNDFETYCGRGQSKDWKRSIRFGGRSLQALINDGTLQPHATSCTCTVCCDDEQASGPVRLFVPYKRKKRKNTIEEEELRSLKPKKVQRNVSKDTSEEFIVDTSGSTINVVNTPTILSSGQLREEQRNSSSDETWRRLEEMAEALHQQTINLKSIIQAAKKQTQQEHINQLSISRTVLEVPSQEQLIAALPPLHPVRDAQVVKPKCVNCNRSSFYICSACSHAAYCSTFCQQRDWMGHQGDCQHRSSGDQHPPPRPIMLIVDSSNHTVLQQPDTTE